MSNEKRMKLKEIEGMRVVFTGIFERFGQKKSFKGYLKPTILLIDIKDGKGVILTEHLWFNYTNAFRELGEIEKGDVIQFTARVKKYYKGYNGYRIDVYKQHSIDYKLSNPTKTVNLTHPEKRLISWEEKAEKCFVCGNALVRCDFLGKIEYYCRKCKELFNEKGEEKNG